MDCCLALRHNFKNLIGNFLFGAMQVPEEFLAGVYGTVERTAFKAVGKEIDYTKQKYISDVGARMTGYFVFFQRCMESG